VNIADDKLKAHAFDLLQRLLRVDTTNPPGNEIEAVKLLDEELRAAGIETTILESAPGRGNIVARLRGSGRKRPLLLTAHLDVVEVEPESWTHPPFCGEVHDGCLWGRGAIDMKNHAAMSVAIMCRLAREGAKLERDLIFAGVADEEAGCRYGSLFLCEQHRELVEAEYAIGEGGGFNIHLGGKSFFTVQVAEKGVCWIKARVRGEPGHGSMPRSDSAVVKMAEAIARLGKRGLPVRPPEAFKEFVKALGENQSKVAGAILPKLLHPTLAPHVLSALPDPSMRRALAAMMGNTASPTVVRAGQKTNVIPGVAEFEIDGRIVPGDTVDDFLAELRKVLGDEVELEVMHALPPVVEQDGTELHELIRDVMRTYEPASPVIPYMLPGFTDAKAFTSIGAKWIGFSPVKMPKEIKFADLFHGHDERIPVDGFHFGTAVLADVVTRFIT
jgi:acetylornithine deacetylase/succinyl-diaminopimelate desuccinylase-like protein